jgi:hypothetical protein
MCSVGEEFGLLTMHFIIGEIFGLPTLHFIMGEVFSLPTLYLMLVRVRNYEYSLRGWGAVLRDQ